MSSNYVPCPKCGGSNAQLLKFSWWGGVLGPKMLTHVKCPDCGNKYNGKTGGDNTAGIAVYLIVGGVAAFVLFFIIFFFLARF